MRIRVLTAFNGMRKGDTGTVTGKDAIDLARGYVRVGLMEVIDDGESETGPGGPAPRDQAGVRKGTPDSWADGGEPGEGFGSGGYESAASEYSG